MLNEPGEERYCKWDPVGCIEKLPNNVLILPSKLNSCLLLKRLKRSFERQLLKRRCVHVQVYCGLNVIVGRWRRVTFVIAIHGLTLAIIANESCVIDMSHIIGVVVDRAAHIVTGRGCPVNRLGDPGATRYLGPFEPMIKVIEDDEGRKESKAARDGSGINRKRLGCAVLK